MSAPKSTDSRPMLQVEFIQLLQDMIGDLTSAPEPVEIKLFSQDPALLREWAPKIGDGIKKIPGVVDVLNGIDNTISGPAMMFQVDPVRRRARRLHRRGDRTRHQRHPAGRAGADAGNAERPRLYDRVRFPERPALPSRTSAIRCWSARPERPRRSVRSRRCRSCPARPRSAARTCSAMWR